MSNPTIPSFVSVAVVTVYAAGLMQGLTPVSFPALSSVLTQGLGFTDAEYGAIFLPQVALTVVGAIGGGALARRIGLKPLLVAALLANAVSQLLLAAGAWAGGGAFLCIMAGTATLGFGFGLLGAPINSYPPILFPRQPHASVVAAHTLLGLGLSVGPLIAGVLVSMGAWYGFPLLLAALCGVLALGTLATALPGEHRMTAGQTPETGRPVAAIQFWIFAGITVLYAFAEGTFANWAVIYLSESKGLTMMTAGLALSVFWGALVLGRLLVTALVLAVCERRLRRHRPVRLSGSRLLGVLSAHHHPAVQPIPEPCRLGLVDDDRRPDGGCRRRLVCHRCISGDAVSGRPIPIVGHLSRRDRGSVDIYPSRSPKPGTGRTAQVAGTKWSLKRYINMDLMKRQRMST
jgi:MFS family permease